MKTRTLNEIFKDNLNDLMKERNINQLELANNVCVTRQAISRYCRGNSLPDIQTLINIANYFGTSVDYLLGNTQTRIKADDLQIAIEGINADAVKRIAELMQGNATAGLRFINTLLDKNDFYKALIYLNTACKVYRLKENEPSMQSNAYISAVKLTNMMESTKEYVLSGDSAIEYFTDKATKVIGEIFKDIVEGKEV